jgi:putative endonuclease
MPTAIQREKTLKKWLRAWKIELIETNSPEWLLLHPETGDVIPFEF